ncbi:MAG: glycosyltransferase, partial [Planctomycetota bacterium]
TWVDRFGVWLSAARIRAWDQRTAGRPDLYMANSRYTADRVRELDGREARVVPPPVRVKPFLEAGRRTAPGDWFLTVQRLESYKRVDIIVEACRRLGLPLKVAGRGPERERLQAMAGPQVEFLGWVPEERLPDLVAGCRAFLFSAEEDFGIAPVEAQAAGRPVIAYAAGGCLETVLPGRTGFLFEAQESSSLMAALEEFRDLRFDPEECRAHARKYSSARFREKILAVAGDLLARGTGILPSAGPQS